MVCKITDVLHQTNYLPLRILQIYGMINSVLCFIGLFRSNAPTNHFLILGPRTDLQKQI